MAMRILSGIIRPLTVGGSVQIGFNPHQLLTVAQPQAGVSRMRTVGPAGDFIRVPATSVAVRQFNIPGDLRPTDAHLIINDQPRRANITVTWRSGGGRPVLIEEIAYMVIGEVP